jgi:hypothetical protein
VKKNEINNKTEGKNFKDGIWNDKQIRNIGRTEIEKASRQPQEMLSQ